MATERSPERRRRPNYYFLRGIWEEIKGERGVEDLDLKLGDSVYQLYETREVIREIEEERERESGTGEDELGVKKECIEFPWKRRR